MLPQNNGTQNIKRGVPAWSEGDHTMHGVPRYPWMDTELIVSENQWDHNATELCNDKMSYGPDFIGSDGYWCDMDKRQVLPICKFHQVEGCIELDFDSNALKKRSTVARRNLLSHHKSYESITNWG